MIDDLLKRFDNFISTGHITNDKTTKAIEDVVQLLALGLPLKALLGDDKDEKEQ